MGRVIHSSPPFVAPLSVCLSVSLSLSVSDLSYFGEWGSIGQVWLTSESSERLALKKFIIIMRKGRKRKKIERR